MNIIRCLFSIIGFVSAILMIKAADPRNNQNYHFYDSSVAQDMSEDSARTKKPFCNAFTGCGKKRSFYSENSVENGEKSTDNYLIPLPIYRALLRAANQEIRHPLDRQLKPEIVRSEEYSYLDHNDKISSQEQYEK